MTPRAVSFSFIILKEINKKNFNFQLVDNSSVENRHTYLKFLPSMLLEQYLRHLNKKWYNSSLLPDDWYAKIDQSFIYVMVTRITVKTVIFKIRKLSGQQPSLQLHKSPVCETCLVY